NDAATEIRPYRIRNAILECGGPTKAARGEGAVDHQRIPAAQRPRERQRIEVQAVTGANDGAVTQPIGQADTRSEQFLADADPRIVRCGSAAPQVHLIGIRVEPFDAFAGSRHQRVVFISEADVDRKVAAYLPAVANVPAELPFAAGGKNVLQALLRILGKPQQEGRISV